MTHLVTLPYRKKNQDCGVCLSIYSLYLFSSVFPSLALAPSFSVAITLALAWTRISLSRDWSNPPNWQMRGLASRMQSGKATAQDMRLRGFLSPSACRHVAAVPGSRASALLVTRAPGELE